MEFFLSTTKQHEWKAVLELVLVPPKNEDVKPHLPKTTILEKGQFSHPFLRFLLLVLLLLAFLTMLCFSWLFFLIPKSQHLLPTLTANNNEKNCINFIFNKFRSSERENPFLLTTILVFCCCLCLVLFLESQLNYGPPYNKYKLQLLRFGILRTRSVGIFLVSLWIPDISQYYLWKFLFRWF